MEKKTSLFENGLITYMRTDSTRLSDEFISAAKDLILSKFGKEYYSGTKTSKKKDSKKLFYYRGLAQWKTEKGYLTDTCLDGQDTFKKMMSMFDIQP